MRRQAFRAAAVPALMLVASNACSSEQRARAGSHSGPIPAGAHTPDQTHARSRRPDDGARSLAGGKHRLSGADLAGRYPFAANAGLDEPLARRFRTPEGYRRVEVEEGSFAEWLRRLPMRPHGSRVRAYNGAAVLPAGSPGLAGVVDLDVGPKNLQQCADTIIRLRAEYLWWRGDADGITFHFTSGDPSRWGDWADGSRPVVRGGDVEWRSRAPRDRSRASFGRYLENLFMYAGTISLARDSVPVPPERIRIGDFFLESGSPGHAVVVLDMAVGPAGGKKAILGQGFMPAQDFHVLSSDGGGPWFDLDIAGAGVKTPFWKVFPWSSLRRFRDVGAESRSREAGQANGSSAPANSGPGARHSRAPVADPRDAAPASRIVHVFVALCDNEHQGIVPAPVELGDGSNPRTNLYWGAMYGVRTYFRRSAHWLERPCGRPEGRPAVLERRVFELSGANAGVLVVADAYDGAMMKAALSDFLDAASGRLASRLEADLGGAGTEIAAGGRADLVCFVGHNGLMDVRLGERAGRRGEAGPVSAMVLACRSRTYFETPLRRARCTPLLTTTGLMAPEAYTLDAAIRSWAAGDAPETIRLEAARAYAKYQRISEARALRLFAAGRGG